MFAYARDTSRAELVQRISKQDPDAYGELYEYYKSPLEKYLFSLVKDRGLADDLRQEVFTSVWKYFLHPESAARFIERFDGWLYTVARNLALNHLKREQKIAFTTMPDGDEYDRFAVLSVEGDEDRICDWLALEEAVNLMSPQYRECLMLHACQGLSYQEIAERMGISDSTVGTNIKNARRQLRDLRAALDADHERVQQCWGESIAGSFRHSGSTGMRPKGTRVGGNRVFSQFFYISQQQKGGVSKKFSIDKRCFARQFSKGDLPLIYVYLYRLKKGFFPTKGWAVFAALLFFALAIWVLFAGGMVALMWAPAMLLFALWYGGVWLYKHNRDQKLAALSSATKQPTPVSRIRPR